MALSSISWLMDTMVTDITQRALVTIMVDKCGTPPTDLGIVEVPANHLSMVMTWGWFMVLGESHTRVL